MSRHVLLTVVATPMLILNLAGDVAPTRALLPALRAQEIGGREATGPAWSLFTAPEEKFRISFPGPPNRTARSAQAGPRVQYSVADRQRGIVYMVDCGPVAKDTSSKAEAPDEVLDTAVAGLIGKERPLRHRPIALGLHPGRFVEIERRDKLVLVIRLFLVDNRLYQIAVCGQGEALKGNTSYTRRFLNSFTIVFPSAGGQDALGAWQELVCRQGGFRAMFPGMPLGEAKETKKGRPHFEYASIDPQTQIRYAVDYSDRRTEAGKKPASPDAVLTTTRDGYARLGWLLHEKRIELDRRPGMELHVSSDRGNLMYVRLFVGEDRVHLCLAVGPPKKLEAAAGDVQRFFDAFRLIPAPSPDESLR